MISAFRPGMRCSPADQIQQLVEGRDADGRAWATETETGRSEHGSMNMGTIEKTTTGPGAMDLNDVGYGRIPRQ